MEKTETCKECNNRFQIIWNSIMYFFDKKQKLIPKSEAFIEATYGKCMTRDQYIAHKQSDINTRIREKVGNISFNTTDFEKYFLLVSFNETEEECSEEIFKPFIDSGYRLEKISRVIPSLQDTNVYLLSWKKT